jgi:site-specific recombinase XerD
MLLSELIEIHLNRMRIEDRSPRYITQRTFVLRHVLAFAGDRPVPEFTRRDAEAYMAWHKQQGVGAGSLYSDVSALRGLISTAVLEGEIGEDWGYKLKYPKLRRKLPGAMPAERAVRLVNEWNLPPNHKNTRLQRFNQVRNRTMIALALFTGARAKEVVGLDFDSLDLAGDRVVFTCTKGEEPRVIPLHPELKPLLEEYIRVRLEVVPIPIKKLPALFVGISRSPSRGRPRGWNRLIAQTYSHIFRTHANSLGLPNERAHNMRHTFATQLLKSGASLPAIQSLLGHKNIATTLIYTKVDEEDKRKAMGGLVSMKLK